MKRSFPAFFLLIFALLILRPFIVNAANTEPVIVDGSLGQYPFSNHVEYLEDPNKELTIDDVVGEGQQWTRETKNAFNFGFIKSAYWFRFSAKNPTDAIINWYIEIDYPMLDSIKLYIPDGEGGFSVRETGDHRPFSNRDVVDKNFMFYLAEKPGTHTYYMRVDSSSSIGFSMIMWSTKADRNRLTAELPIVWGFYGLMLIMVVYNLFIFFSVRDISYVYYIIYIISCILFQLTFSGYSFQYLWPNSIWWANNCLPFIMCISNVGSGLFLRSYLQTREHHRIIDKVAIFGMIVPGIIFSLITLAAPYRIAIMIAILLIVFCSVLPIVLSGILTFQGSRPARFYFIAMLSLLLGTVATALKAMGVLPSFVLGSHGIAFGASVMVLLFSLGLADKITTMRKDLEQLFEEHQENEKIVSERAKFLEGVVNTVNSISGEFTRMSRKLHEVSGSLSLLSSEQASSSEEFSATFEELTASTEQIHKSSIRQKEEGEKSRQMIAELNAAQKHMITESFKVADGINEIANSATSSKASLSRMSEKIMTINTGGNEISEFVTIIDDISDRINLLSLNAAIEAARAGEYGRGFAVVADEIGKLAQATSDNSNQIKDKINKIIRDIDEGAQIVGNTTQATDAIFGMLGDIQARTDQVKKSMEVQSTGVKTVVTQAAIIDEATRDIATGTAEQMSSMNQSLKTIERLSEMASEVAQVNEKIIEMTKTIIEKSEELSRVVNA